MVLSHTHNSFGAFLHALTFFVVVNKYSGNSGAALKSEIYFLSTYIITLSNISFGLGIKASYSGSHLKTFYKESKAF